jgi:hypothetical protein
MMSNKSEINVKHVIFENNIKRNVKSIGNIEFFFIATHYCSKQTPSFYCLMPAHCNNNNEKT